MTPHLIRLVDDTLVIDGPQGDVRIQLEARGLKIDYLGDQLVNGSALAYAQQRVQDAVEYVQQFPFPWEIAADGTQRITDHNQFYQQTFNPDLAGIETLKHWLGQQNVDTAKAVQV